MRRASSDYEFITENGNVVGISLGYEYCAEHEWGIKKTADILGILGVESGGLMKKQRIGLDARVSTIFTPDRFFFGKKGDYTGLIMRNDYMRSDNGEVNDFPWDNLPMDLEGYQGMIKRNQERKNDPLVTAWSDGSFGVIIKGKEGKILEEILESFKNTECLVMYMGSENPFANASLALMPKSNMIKIDTDGKIVKNIEAGDNAEIKRKSLSDKLDLEGKLRKAGKWYDGNYDNIMCASIKVNKGKPTVWINASKHFGWYSVEEVQNFIKDKTGKQINEFKAKKT